MDFGIMGVATITTLCYLAGDMVKATGLNNKWIPTIVGLFGVALGIVSYLIGTPEFPATDIISAAAIGAVSGFAATGVNQVTKQLTKDGE